MAPAANMQRFFEQIGQGGDLRTRAETATGISLNKLVEMDLQQAEGPIKRLVDFAGKEGHPFTRDELVSAFRQQVGDVKKNGGNGELSDGDLAAVAGGGPGGFAVGAVIGGLAGLALGSGAGFFAAGPATVAGAGLGGDIGSNLQDFATRKWGNW